MGSKQFIKLTDQVLLPLIVNIVIESTDEAAITRYAGSSFTKSTDLTKFKSIIVSFFRLAKQSLCKWALWVPNSEYKFKASFMSMQMKGINFQSQFKYYRPQNQTNFIKNCQQNDFQLQSIDKKASGINTNNNQQQRLPESEKQQVKKSNINITKETPHPDKIMTVNNSKESSKISQRQQQQKSISLQSIPEVSLVSIGKRYPPQGNNKHILQCHQIFKKFDEKLKKGIMKDEDVETMKNQINSQLEEYMGTPDLNQTQMESELTPIFENIKNCSDDYAKFKQKQLQSQNNLSMQSSVSKMKNTLKKTEPLSTKKNQRPLSPISKLQTPMKLSPKDQGINNLPQHLQLEMKSQTPQAILIKEEEIPVKLTQKKQEVSKVQVFDDSSMIESQVKSRQKSNQKSIPKIQEEVSKSAKKVQSLSNLSKKVNQALKEEQKSNEAKKSAIKASKKGGTREHFDSQLSVSHTESSRVIFSESSNDEESNDEESKISTNFKKQRPKLKLSSIAEEEMEKYGESSRRINNQPNQQYNLRRDLQSIKEEQRKIVVEKSSLLPSEVKVPKSAIDDYESKIRNLQENLQFRQQKERQISIKLSELNQIKQHQQRQLEKIKVQNNKIMKRFSNAVDGEEYWKIKRDFDEMKDRNRRMEGQLEKLLKEIQDLKLVQKAQAVKKSHIAIQSDKQNNSNSKPKSPKKLFQSPQYMLTQSMNRKPIILQPQKPKYTFQQFDTHENRVNLSKINEILDENNLNLLKKNIIGGDELFYTSEQVSFVCRTLPFKNQRLTLQLDLSFQFKGGRRKPINPHISIPNIEEAEVWKKQVVGDENLFHLDIVVKLKKFPFSLMKIELQWENDMRKSVYLPLVYWNFLRKGELNQLEFDKFFGNNAESVIKSKVFNLNSKVVKDLKSLAAWRGYNLVRDNRMCFKLYEESQNSKVFWCQLTNLCRQKCILKIVPQPYNQEMVNKADQLVKNILFVVG